MSNQSKYTIEATVGSTSEFIYERAFDTREERAAFKEGLNAGVGWMEFQREVNKNPSTPEAVVITMTPEQAEFVQENARENGVSFEDYAGNLFDKGLHLEGQKRIA